MVEMAEYFADNPQIVVNGFMRTGIAGVLDGHQDEQKGRESEENETENDFDCTSSDTIEIIDED